MNRSDDSGTTFNFTDYLAKAAPDSWPYPAGETWPVKGGEAAEGTSGVVEAVTAGEGAIGYADASQAGDLGIAKVKVGNEYIAPSAEGAAHDLEISKDGPDDQWRSVRVRLRHRADLDRHGELPARSSSRT